MGHGRRKGGLKPSKTMIRRPPYPWYQTTLLCFHVRTHHARAHTVITSAAMHKPTRCRAAHNAAAFSRASRTLRHSLTRNIPLSELNRMGAFAFADFHDSHPCRKAVAVASCDMPLQARIVAKERMPKYWTQPGLQNWAAENGCRGFEIGRVRTGCLALVEKAQYLHTPFLSKHRKNELIVFRGRKTDSAPKFWSPGLSQFKLLFWTLAQCVCGALANAYVCASYICLVVRIECWQSAPQ